MRHAVLAVLIACSSRDGMFRGEGSTWHEDPPKDVVALVSRDLSAKEQALVDANGFAILGSATPQSFHVGYTALFHAHQPVYVTADSLLYAWHSSYDKILTELETDALVPTLAAMLDELRAGLAKSEAPAQARADVDVYLAVAQSLMTDAVQAPVAGGDRALIGATFEHGQKAEGLGTQLFGEDMQFDFSMLKPRGHYADSPYLQRYFRAMSWLGRAEITIAQREPGEPWRVHERALAAAKLLGTLFTDKTRARWTTIDTTLAAFVGPPDSMSLPGLEAGLAALGAGTSGAQVAAAFGPVAHQKINTQLRHAGSESIAFLVLGQRFVFDASVLGDLAYDALVTEPMRMMPTPLDVAAAVFHNPAAQALLAPDSKRYGPAYDKALAAKSAEPIPDGSIYHMWLGALRELSPRAGDALPAPLTSDAWQRRMLQTQLASWAELRHDNLLYAKQSFTGEAGCEFPSAYIDPYPAFYAKLEAIAVRGRAVVDKLPFRSGRGPQLVHYFDGMAKTMAHLRAIAERERANQPMTDDDLQFIDHMVSLDGRNAVCTTTIDPMGWYAELFIDQKSALWHEPVIADVHTQPTDEDGKMVGRVLHVSTGTPRMMVVRIRHDGGAHTQTYRGLVSSYGELVTDNFQRLTDEEWREKIRKRMQGTPSWLASIVAP
jgi:hypothetical protein